MSAPEAIGDAPALVLEHVTVEYRSRGTTVTALSDVSLTATAGETIAIVGESGAGKSTLTRIVAGVERASEGRVSVLGRTPRPRSGVVSPVQVVFQHPLLALSPYRSVGSSIAEPLRRLPAAARVERAAALLEQVGLDPRRAGERPTQFSGGQLQRIVLARALAAEPAVLICDEATSALDVSVQAQIANLLMTLQQQLGFACLLVTHDLGLARVLADRVLVLERGRAVEYAAADRFFSQPRSPYAASLLAATRGQSIAC